MLPIPRNPPVLLSLLLCLLLWTPDAQARREIVVRGATKPSAAPPVPPLPADAPPEVVAGARLYLTAGCVGCHSPPFTGATHLAGDRDLPTTFGVFYSPNISPHPTDGIGGWTEEDFFKAMRRGIAPDGHRYWPTFPYMAYTKMADEDIRSLWAYLRSQPAVEGTPREREMSPGYGLPGMLGMWRLLAFRSGEYKPDKRLTDVQNRGAYLVQAVGYCDQCHTPRGRTGLLKKRHYMAGGANPGKSEVHPNLTPDMENGLGEWSVEDIVRFLSTGDKPDGTRADHEQVMEEKIADSYRWFSEADKVAIAEYLKSLPADDFDPFSWEP